MVARMRSVMKHQFSMIPHISLPRSVFNRSHGVKTTFNAGNLVPVYVDEVLPGDTLTLNITALVRMTTPLVPFMDNLFVDFFWFAVPNRLLWSNWEKFNGEQVNPTDSTDFYVPQVVSPAGGWLEHSLADYMGLPIKVAGLSVSALHFRAYNKIWNEWFRDQNLQNSVTELVNDGPDPAGTYTVLRRGKRHDYFTSCLPWPQKGTAVDLPIGDVAPVYGDGKSLGFWDGTTKHGWAVHGTDNTKLIGAVGSYNAAVGGTMSGGSSLAVSKNLGVVPKGTDVLPNYSGLYADLSDATGGTINSLRQAFQLQHLFERDARGGTRYIEIIRSHFGVVSLDARMQRPEFLGSGSARIHVTPVQQTSSTDATTPQGHLAAYAMTSDSQFGFSKSFTEHCVVMGLACVRADLTYQQGIRRMWSRSTRFDFYWPALAHLGEQAVLNKEIYAQGPAVKDGSLVVDDKVFGYQERWAEYRYFPSQITGKLRSTATSPLESWHLSEKFTSLPTLGATFIQENPPISRVVAVPSQPHFVMDAYIDLRAVRPMPVYSVPGKIDHL